MSGGSGSAYLYGVRFLQCQLYGCRIVGYERPQGDIGIAARAGHTSDAIQVYALREMFGGLSPWHQHQKTDSICLQAL